ncbi:hypothetical protein GOP47_0009267 [Adiantum capillus-veneris]|uniref:Uncharacterized protein n=1 Tax=Adiantum capillus-veneris TaxID=13818 RepID=A0A9D4ZJD0_ADICA|nr:hypothetical protein GOP47_0009267 [Adiantum capillus-veneris]
MYLSAIPYTASPPQRGEQLDMCNVRANTEARVAPPDVAASGVAPDWASSSSSSLQDNTFKERLNFSSPTNFNGSSSISAAPAAAAAVPAQLSSAPPSHHTLGATAGAGASPSTSRWESRASFTANFPYQMASFQAPAASGSELPLAISGEEVARQSAGFFAAALGPFSSQRLMPGSGSATSGASREHGGLSNEPTYSSVGRDMMVRGEDFVGLYTGLSRLGGGLEGGSTTLSSTNPGLMNVGATGIARAGAKPAMVSFVGGEFRLQGMGRGMEEVEGEGMTSMQPLASNMARRGGHEGEGEATARREASWQQGDPNVHDLLQRERSAAQEQQEMEAEARGAVKEPSGLMMGGGGEHHHHQQQRAAAAAAQAHQLAMVRVNEGGERGLDQQRRLLEQQQEQHQRELMMRSQRGIVVGAVSGGGGTTACYDCGNQAKKDCPHMRCRTCCKSRGFDCATHVKSTWVPVSKRRQRLQQQGLLNPSTTASGEQQQYQESLKLARLKRARTLSLTAGGGSSSTMAGAAHHAGAGAAPSHTSTSTGTPPRSSDINSAPPAPPTHSQEGQARGGLFPPAFRTEAVFKCVRITGMMDGQDEYAYQTEVRIGGHIFKGILHDQGTEKSDLAATNIAELQLGSRNIQSSTAALMDLSGMYASGGNAMLGSAFR